jgi:predicted dehydrogenase
MTRPIRIGVAGLGAVAQTVHLPLLARRSDLFSISAVAEISPATRERVGSRYGVPEVRRVTSTDELIGLGGLDGIMVLTGGSHGADALASVAAGLPVFCEKPLAYSQAEARALIDADAGAERPMVLLAYMKQYDPAATRLADIVARSTGIRAVDVQVLHPSDESQLAFAKLPPRVDDADPGLVSALAAATDTAVAAAIGRRGDEHARLYTNILLGSIVHDTSLLRGMFGSLATVDLVRRYGGEPGSVEIIGTFAGGLPLSLTWHYIPEYPAYRETVTVHHGRGSAGVVFPCPYLLNAPSELRVVSNVDGAEQVTAVRSVVEEFEVELEAFAAMVREGTPPRSGPAEGLADIITAQRMYARYADGYRIPIAGEAAAVGADPADGR